MNDQTKKEALTMMNILEDRFWHVGLSDKEYAILTTLEWLFKDEAKPTIDF